MNKYTVNFRCKNKNGQNVVRSEEFFWIGINEVIEIIKLEWIGWDIEIIWAGIRPTNDM